MRTSTSDTVVKTDYQFWKQERVIQEWAMQTSIANRTQDQAPGTSRIRTETVSLLRRERYHQTSPPSPHNSLIILSSKMVPIFGSITCVQVVLPMPQKNVSRLMKYHLLLVFMQASMMTRNLLTRSKSHRISLVE